MTDTNNDLVKDKKDPKAYRTIGEAARIIGVQQHVLRFWEGKFTYLKPVTRSDGRRFYRPSDIDLLKAIHNMLYEQGYSIRGVQKLFNQNKKKGVLLLGGITVDDEDAPEKSAEMVDNQASQDSAQKFNDTDKQEIADLVKTIHNLRTRISHHLDAG